MFTTGQWIFAASFLVVFVIASVYVYKKDKSLHREHYKGSYRVLIGFLFFIGFLYVMKYFLKH